MVLVLACVLLALVLLYAVIVKLATARNVEFLREYELVSEVDRPDNEHTPVTLFQRYILSQYRAKHGIPKLSQANLALVRRDVYALLIDSKKTKELVGLGGGFKNSLRTTDLEMHASKITMMAFVPSSLDVKYSEMLFAGEKCGGWFGWLFGHTSGPIRERIDSYLRGPQ